MRFRTTPKLSRLIWEREVWNMLSIKDCHIRYGHIHAVKGVTFDINEGEIVTLIGANGAGKSTILNTIAGLYHPSEGSIEFMGEDISRTPPARIVKKGISLSPEGRRIFPGLTVYENLLMGSFIRKDREVIDDELETVYNHFPILKQRLKQAAGTLSGGEQQMLAIGRSLMSKPRILMLDEPSLGLAPLLVEQIFKIISDIHKEGTTILLVEQKAYLALELAQRGYVIETGQIILSGTTSELLRNEYVKNAYLG